MVKLPQVVDVDEEKCVNCHACIAACPVKFCNNGSGSHVTINHDLCIGCGNCIKACTHEARRGIDDSEAFLDALRHGESMIAIAAPAVAAAFPNQYLKLNGWLRSIGVQAVFDVSYGAELTVKSYLDHIQKNKPACVISQPCPALVTFVEIYHPELLRHLAPADSPMLHTIKMVREFHSEYRRHKVVVISPCLAKKREFADTGLGDYNLTMKSLQAILETRKVDLSEFPELDYDNPPAERAVLFSTPGGLMATAARWNPAIPAITRKIEGVEHVYHYLERLNEMIVRGSAPALVDCLNCSLGCNGGPGTRNSDAHPDQVESLVARRDRAAREKYARPGASADGKAQKALLKLINQHWKPGLYNRSYQNKSANNTIRHPNERQLDEIYKGKLMKSGDKDILNCGACGYGSCEKMATAIFNGLNKPENCHTFIQHTLAKQEERARVEMDKLKGRVGLVQRVAEGDVTVKFDVEGEHDSLGIALKLMSEKNLERMGMVLSLADGNLAGEIKISSDRDEFGKALHLMASRFHDRIGMLDCISRGDLSRDVEVVDGNDFFGQALKRMADSLRELIGKVNHSVTSVHASSSQIGDASASLSSGTTQQASALQQIASTNTQVTSQANTNAERAKTATTLAKHADQLAEKGKARVQSLVGAMKDIDKASSEIGAIMKLMDDIAFQTNILALNAAVEAARAGRFGKGFAVVAEEVRNLAGKSAKAAQKTQELVDNAIGKVNVGNKHTEETASSLEMIVESVVQVAQLLDEISRDSTDQAKGIEQVDSGLCQISSITQQNASNAEEMANISHEMLTQVESLRDLVTRFKLSEDAPTSLPELRSHPQHQPHGHPAPRNLAPGIHISLDDTSLGRY